MGIRVSFTSMTFRRTASVIVQNCSTSLPFDSLLLPRYTCQNTYLTLNNLAASISYPVRLLLLSQPIYPNRALVLSLLHLALCIAPLKQSAPRVGDLFFLLISGYSLSPLHNFSCHLIPSFPASSPYRNKVVSEK